jgi:hypothetical protein
MLSDTDYLSREEVHDFLCRLQDYMRKELADREGVKNKVSDAAKGKDYEASMVDEFVLPSLNHFLAEHDTQNLNGKKPEAVTLAESRSARSKYAVGSPVRTPGHPFQKVIAAKPKEIFARWKGGELNKPKSAFGQVCPDLALTSPYRVVIECKYFRTPGLQPATDALVKGLYETFFYRAMPPGRQSRAGGTSWNYEYACFFAYDASANLRLVKAWNEVKKRVEEPFWSEGNIFVMMIPEEAR